MAVLLSPVARITQAIYIVRGHRVILDVDLAPIYGVSAKRLNEQVKRNLDRFPADFMFRLTTKEKADVVAVCDHLQRLKYSPTLPFAFTEHGAVVLAAVLGTPAAVQASVQVVRAFQNFAQLDKPSLPSRNDYRFTLYPPILAKR